MGVRDFHPKMKGNLGEATVAAELIRKGCPVFLEFGDLGVDLFVVCVYDRDVLLYIRSSMICSERRTTTFRLDPPRNGQEMVRAAPDFADFEMALR